MQLLHTARAVLFIELAPIIGKFMVLSDEQISGQRSISGHGTGGISATLLRALIFAKHVIKISITLALNPA